MNITFTANPSLVITASYSTSAIIDQPAVGEPDPVGYVFTNVLVNGNPQSDFVFADAVFVTTSTVAPDPTPQDLTCFAPGTLIATPDGATRVEALRIGDQIRTADGRAVPVTWIGRRTVLKGFAGERARPVRVTAGALGDGLPHRDLVLTADHALILDGLAINAGALVNGTTITLDPLATLPERITHYHVETADHDVILANGAPAESYIDYLGRRTFDNHAEYAALYGQDRFIPEMLLPRIGTARLVPPGLRQRLARGAAA